MSIITAKTIQEAFPEIPTDLPEEDGVPLESDWHRLEMTLLIELVTCHPRAAKTISVGGNMFIYFDAPAMPAIDIFAAPISFSSPDAALNPLCRMLGDLG